MTLRHTRTRLPEWARGLDLVIVAVRDGGHNYEWHDETGRVVCCGWTAGTKRDARDEAHQHLLEGRK